MALGNANSSAQARGKNKPILVKRRKEVVAAKGYNSFTSCTVQSNGSNACAATMDQTYYHNGSSTLPGVGDKVYFKQRAGDRFLLGVGHYKIDVGRGAFKSISIDSSGEVDSITNCR
jgi:hypothetical protein